MNTVEEYNCVFCKECFNSKEDLQIHFRKHGDPNFNQSSKIQNEAGSSKKSSEQEEVACDVCTEVFPTISKAITHKHKVHPDHDTKYFCPWCGKLFTLKHLYNKHLQANHEKEEKNDHRILHCDCCNVDFYRQVALMSHNKFFHRQEELPMVGQSKKLKLYDKEVVQIHYCSFCGEEYENKINLHKHIKDEHGDENHSPDDILRCPLCDAIFFHLDAYEVHLTFHSVEDIYTEKNELFNDVTEFSLESIPPMYEKVESYAPQEDNETALGAVGIENFLELAMGSESHETSKHKKKHKKHKKSKKAAITLDEFLNMNTDLFGEGLDIQGVEEVPTQVISKRLKVKKPSHSKAKLNPELEKLKKQGIVIKKNTIPNEVYHSQSIKISPEAVKSIKAVKINKQNDPMTKLIIKNKNQLKIVRKSSQENTAVIKDNEELLPGNDTNDLIKNNKYIEQNPVHNSQENNESNSETNNDKNTSVESEIRPETRSPSPDNDKQFLSKEICNRVCDENTEDTKVILELKKGFKPTQFQNIDEFNHILVSPNRLLNVRKEKSQSDSLNKLSKNEHDKISIHNESDDKQVLDETEKDPKETPKSSVNDSLSALKHLSHLITIKPVSSPKSSPDLKNIDSEYKNSPDAADVSGNETNIKSHVSITRHNNPVSNNSIIAENKVSNTFKNLGNNVIIKTVGQANKNEKFASTLDEQYDADESIDDEKNTIENNSNDFNTCVAKEAAKISKQSETFNDVSKLNKTIKEENKSIDVRTMDEDSKSQTNQEILKRLTNITAKPIKPASNQIVPIYQTPPQLQCKTKVTKQINEHNIEVFNIEDSDSDEMDQSQNTPCPYRKPASNPKESSNSVIKISSNPVHQQQTVNKSFTKTVTKSKIMHNEQQSYHSEESCNKKEFRQVKDTKCINSKTVSETAVDEKSLAIKNVLKSLGKNITIKSRTSSPSQSIKSQDNDSQDSYTGSKDDGSDVDSEPGHVKITELGPNASDNENISGDDARNNDCEQNMSVQSPHCSENSEHEDHNENFDEQDDIESHITASKLEKPKLKTQNKNPTPPQNVNKSNVNLSNDDQGDTEEEPSNAIVPFIPKNLGSQISVKHLKQKLESQNENIKNMRQVNASSSNQKVSNQMNTVNKAVTIKTFQTETETVIEEITTTVTKTIKTVKQEMKNTSQCSNSVVVPQKVQGIRPSQVVKNYHGTKVKQMPSTGLRIRNPAQVRPVIYGPIKPANQASPIRASSQPVPVQSRANIARQSAPRMPVIKNNASATSNQANNPKKPIKISPSLGSVSAKRVNTDDASGPFSCFKKPKESLIPVSDVSAFNSVGDSDQYTSSQVNKSNFVTTTKTVKGNTVVSQMKYEMSASSSQQLSKLNNMSGLKVVKTSQAKQTVIQEKSEVITPKRTLEAIERLQKSGLLVKKPRLDVIKESDHSDQEEEAAYDPANQVE